MDKELNEEIKRLTSLGLHRRCVEGDISRVAALTLEINRLKKERNAVVCAHVYQTPDIILGIGDLAGDSYKLADDHMSITFTLRKGIQFHDGSSFNATVAKWNMDNQITAKKTSTWASVDLIDDYTVRVNFTKWQNTNRSGFSGATAWMVSKAAFDKNGLDYVRQNPIGTGPFKFVSFLKDTSFKTI